MITALLLALLIQPDPEPLPADAPEPAEPAAAVAPVPPATLEGTVRDAQTGAPFEGVMVLVDGEVAGTTGPDGRFSVGSLAPGEHLVSLMGPQGQELHNKLSLAAGTWSRRTYTLQARELESVSVVQRVERTKREAGEVSLSQQEVAAVPGTFGDPVRVIENLPGASRAPGGMGGALIIRGANPADSGVLMDGIQIPLLYHFGGLTSVVNSEFLSAVTFLPGGFGAQYGRATGGVAEVQSAALSCEKLRASASVDPLDAELFGCVPIGRWRVAAAARRSYVDSFLPALLESAAKEGESPTIVSPTYFDYQVKAERAWGRQRFELFAFGSRDGLSVSRAGSAEDADLSLGGSLSFHRLQARHLYFGERLTLESAVVPGFLGQMFRDGSQELSTSHHSGADVYTVQWRETATFRLSERITARGGIDHMLTRWNADFVTELPTLARRYPTPLIVDNRDQNLWKKGNTGLDQAYWAELVLNPTEQLTVTPGARVGNLVFDRSQRFVVEPRLATRWQASEHTALTAAGGIYRKLPEMFSGVMVEGFGQPGLAAERAVQLVAGVERRLGPLETKAEGFYVRRDRLPSPTDEVEVRDGKAEPVLFRSDGHGRSYGLELMLRLPAEEPRRFSGWVAYTLSRSTRSDRLGFASGGAEFDSYDPGTPRLAELTTQNHEYLSPFDQTHILTTVGRWELPWAMSLGFRFQLVSGNPTTPLERGEAYYDADSDRYQVRPGSVAAGSGRLPTFHRLDVRLDKRWQFSHWRLTAYLELMNAYNRRPVESFGYDYRYRTRTELKGLPILPLLGLKGEL
jgi:outer membrane receptor protein involved in Fe transport